MGGRLKNGLLLAPGLGWLGLFMVVPCAIVFFFSFFERGTYGGIEYHFTLDNFRRTLDPLYLSILLDSGRIAALATLLALLIAYPAAYAISLAPRRRQSTPRCGFRFRR